MAHPGDRGCRGTVVEFKARRYSANMEKLDALLDRLKDWQRRLINEAAEQDGLPATSVIDRIAALENAIAAVEAVADEVRERQRH